MSTLRAALFLALSAATLACGSSSDPDTAPPKQPPPAAGVDVSIASVTLADDCGGGPTTPPDAPEQIAQAEQARSMEEPARKMAPGASMSMGDRACEQSSIQLRVANTTGAGSKVVIQKVELYDASGTMVGELTPRAPSRWADDSYQAWDGAVAPSQTLQVSYALSAPTVMRGATYTVKVVVAAGDGERTLEKQATLEAEASLPPGVVT